MKTTAKFNPSLAAATSKAKTLAAEAKPAKAPRAATAAKEEAASAAARLVQFNLRLEPELRERIRHAAWLSRVSERELVERWARDLPDVTPAPKGKPWK